MGKFSSRKGAAFERRIAKMFSEAWGVKLLRTPQSGGWGRAKTKGDLVPELTEAEGVHFPYFVECKNDQSWNLWSMLFADAGPVCEWWTKAKAQASEEGKVPLLVIGRNQMPPLVLMKYNSQAVPVSPRVYFKCGGEQLVLTRLLDFLAVHATVKAD